MIEIPRVVQNTKTDLFFLLLLFLLKSNINEEHIKLYLKEGNIKQYFKVGIKKPDITRLESAKFNGNCR